VLHLQTGIQFQKVESSVGVVQVLDGSRADVPDLLGESHGAALHLAPHGLGSGHHRALLDDLLMATLDAAVWGHDAEIGR
jgi:hypothetical protein